MVPRPSPIVWEIHLETRVTSLWSGLGEGPGVATGLGAQTQGHRVGCAGLPLDGPEVPAAHRGSRKDQAQHPARGWQEAGSGEWVGGTAVPEGPGPLQISGKSWSLTWT